MPAVPTVDVTINFSTGASFADAFLIGYGVFGRNVLADSTSVIVDVSDQVQSVQTTRGRNLLTDVFQTGTATVILADTNGDFNPQNSSSPYYSNLLPLRKLSVSAIDPATGISSDIFSGYITGYNYQQSQKVGEVSTTTITAVDAFQLLTLATVSSVPTASAGQLSGARITSILDAVGWPTSLRIIDTGLTTVQADPGTARTGLSALQTVATTEYGAIYTDPSGNIVFKDRKTTESSVSTTPTNFVDSGVGIKYSNAQWVLNDAQIFNQANVTATGLAQQTYKDQTSIDTYFLHSYDVNNLLMETTTEANNYARAYVASRKDTSIRCDSITLNLYTENYTTGITKALTLNYFDPITVTQTQPGASTITKTLQIFGVAHSITPQSWMTRFTTAEPIIDAFVVGTDFGKLGVNVLSY